MVSPVDGVVDGPLAVSPVAGGFARLLTVSPADGFPFGGLISRPFRQMAVAPAHGLAC